MWYDYVLSVISALCTVISVYQAYKARKYFNKTKYLSGILSMNRAFLEACNVIDVMRGILYDSNKGIKKGKNIYKALADKGNAILSSIDKIKSNVPYSDNEEIAKILNNDRFDCVNYINLFVSGNVIKDGEVLLDDDFKSCQDAFERLRNFIKLKTEEYENKLK